MARTVVTLDGLARYDARIKELIAATPGGGGSGQAQVWYGERTAGEFYKGDDAPTSADVGKFDGYLYATRVYNAVYNDYAELFEASGPVAPGFVAYARDDGTVAGEGDPGRCVGVCSDRWGYLVGGSGDPEGDGFVAVSLAGRVPVAVNGDVEVGDLLVANADGTAQRAGKSYRGRVLGKCVGPDPDGRPGFVNMLVGVM